MNHYEQNVSVAIPVGGDLYRRIWQEAANSNRSFHEVFASAVRMGLQQHMVSNLDLMEGGLSSHLQKYADALEGVGPAMREEILRRASTDPALSCQELKQLVTIAYPDNP